MVMVIRNIVRNNLIVVSILIYIFLYSLILVLKPAFLYNLDGSLREFGIGLRRKTVIPAWLLAIMVSLTSYFIVLYYVTSHRL
jgi:hypothetical protein